MLPTIPILVVLLACVKLISGAFIDVNPDFANITKRAPNTPILFEKCYGDVSTKLTYHVQLVGLHVHGDGSKPLATTCGDPKGSPHYNLHFDTCKPRVEPPCNNCVFPFTTYKAYQALRSKYLVMLYNWHAFEFASGGHRCICLWDSKTNTKYQTCFNNGGDLEAALQGLAKNVEGMAKGIWQELVNIPWISRVAVISLVFAACVILFMLAIEALVAAGVALTPAIMAGAVALLEAGLSAVLRTA